MNKRHLAVRIALFALILSLGSLAALVAGETQGMALADVSGAPVQALTSAVGGTTLYAVLAGADDQAGVYRSQDGGATWQRAGAGPDGAVNALAVHPHNAALLYAATSSGPDRNAPALWTSADGGQTWQPSPLGLPASPEGRIPDITALAADPRQPGIVYVGSAGQGVYRFDTNPGRYGFELVGGLELHTASVSHLVVASDGQVYALTSDGLFASDGRSWQKLSLPEAAASLAVAPGDPRLLYAGGVSTGVYRSSDGGRTWERAGLDIPAGAALRVTALAVAEDNPRRVAVATAIGLGSRLAPDGVYVSRDGGYGWTRLADADGLVTQLSFNQGALYAASARGLARYDDDQSALATAPSRGTLPTWDTWLSGSLLERLAQPNGVQALILALTLALAGLALVGRLEWIVKRQ